MRWIIAGALAAMLSGAPPAHAAAPGVNIGWNSCALTSATQSIWFACDANEPPRLMVASFRMAYPVSNFGGVEILIEVRVGAATLEDWWQFAPGGCREGALRLDVPGAVQGCATPWSGAGVSAGYTIETTAVPTEFHIRAVGMRDVAGPLRPTTLYKALALELSAARTVDTGDGACAGCESPACFTIRSAVVRDGNGAPITTLDQDVRIWCTWQGGGFGAGCPPGWVPARPSTWGAIKSLYR